jgi:5-methylcytosine-specific restriction endonuclease McrA
MAKLVLARIDPEAKRSPVAPKVRAPDAQEPTTAASDTPPAELVTPETRHIPATIKREVWIRDRGRCSWPGCASRYALQYDHIVPYSHGGAHAASNLRLLCRARGG